MCCGACKWDAWRDSERDAAAVGLAGLEGCLEAGFAAFLKAIGAPLVVHGLACAVGAEILTVDRSGLAAADFSVLSAEGVCSGLAEVTVNMSALGLSSSSSSCFSCLPLISARYV